MDLRNQPCSGCLTLQKICCNISNNFTFSRFNKERYKVPALIENRRVTLLLTHQVFSTFIMWNSKGLDPVSSHRLWTVHINKIDNAQSRHHRAMERLYYAQHPEFRPTAEHQVTSAQTPPRSNHSRSPSTNTHRMNNETDYRVTDKITNMGKSDRTLCASQSMQTTFNIVDRRGRNQMSSSNMMANGNTDRLRAEDEASGSLGVNYAGYRPFTMNPFSLEKRTTVTADRNGTFKVNYPRGKHFLNKEMAAMASIKKVLESRKAEGALPPATKTRSTRYGSSTNQPSSSENTTKTSLEHNRTKNHVQATDEHINSVAGTKNHPTPSTILPGIIKQSILAPQDLQQAVTARQRQRITADLVDNLADQNGDDGSATEQERELPLALEQLVSDRSDNEQASCSRKCVPDFVNQIYMQRQIPRRRYFHLHFADNSIETGNENPAFATTQHSDHGTDNGAEDDHGSGECIPSPLSVRQPMYKLPLGGGMCGPQTEGQVIGWLSQAELATRQHPIQTVSLHHPAYARHVPFNTARKLYSVRPLSANETDAEDVSDGETSKRRSAKDVQYPVVSSAWVNTTRTTRLLEGSEIPEESSSATVRTGLVPPSLWPRLARSTDDTTVKPVTEHVAQSSEGGRSTARHDRISLAHYGSQMHNGRFYYGLKSCDETRHGTVFLSRRRD